MKKRKTNKAKRIDRSCRNHGTCPYCTNSRTHSNKKNEFEAIAQVKENSNDKRTKTYC